MEWRYVTFSPCFFFFLLHVAALVGQPAVAGTAAAPVRVGVILNLASATGLRLQTTVRMAVEDYYAAHPNSATRVELHFRDSHGDAVGAISAAEDLIKNAQVGAIIGPQTPAAAEFVATVGSRANVPVLSFSATAPPLSPSDARFLVRTCADGSFAAAAVADVLRSFGWRGAVLLHEDSRAGSGIVAALADALRGVGGGVVGRVAVRADASDDRLDAVLYRAMAMVEAATRVFVVHMPPALARRLFRRAKDADMMSRGSVWIATPAIDGDDRLTADDMDTMQGVILVRPHVQANAKVKNFASRLNARLRQENAGFTDIHDPPVSMLWAYDTAWAVAMAAEADGHGVSVTGATLLDAVLDTTFDGLAGKFKLVDGQLQAPTYEIVNVAAEGPKIVGFWTGKTGITPDSDSNTGSGTNKIIWPGRASLAGVPKVAAPSPNNGKELVVALPVKHGFNQFVDVSNDSTITGRPRITGYCVDVFDAAMKILPYPVRYQYVPFNGSSKSYDQIVRLLPQKRADAVVGDVTITSIRMGEVEYTMSYTDSGWSMVVPVEARLSTGMFFFLKPLKTSLWISSLTFFVFTGFVVWVIEHRVNPEFRGTPWQQFGIIFYYAFSTLVFAQREKLESNFSRFMVIVWLFAVLILTSTYTASLTSMLTVQELQPTVTDASELIRRGDYVGYQEGSFVAGELKRMNFDERKMRSYSTPEQYAEALSKGSANGGVAAIFDEIPYLKYFLSHNCKGYTMAGPVYDGAGFGFIFPKGSAMASDVSRAVASLTEGEEMARIMRKWFGDPGACDKQGSGVGSPILSFWNFSGLFLITGAATGLMLAVYVVTFPCRGYDTKDAKSPTSSKRADEGSVPNGADAKPRSGAGKGDEVKARMEQREEEDDAASAPEGKASLNVLMKGEERKG
ncbi:hypothetical protein ACP70R_049399 [Stipagrostis hirtigluma subsp. patula]